MSSAQPLTSFNDAGQERNTPQPPPVASLAIDANAQKPAVKATSPQELAALSMPVVPSDQQKERQRISDGLSQGIRETILPYILQSGFLPFFQTAEDVNFMVCIVKKPGKNPLLQIRKIPQQDLIIEIKPDGSVSFEYTGIKPSLLCDVQTDEETKQRLEHLMQEVIKKAPG